MVQADQWKNMDVELSPFLTCTPPPINHRNHFIGTFLYDRDHTTIDGTRIPIQSDRLAFVDHHIAEPAPVMAGFNGKCRAVHDTGGWRRTTA